MKLIFIVISLLTLSLSLSAKNIITPTKIVKESIKFDDDLDFAWLPMALDRQIESFQNQNLTGSIRLGTAWYPKKRLFDSVILFKEIVEQAQICLINQNLLLREECYVDFNAKINNNFTIYAPTFTSADPEYSRPRPALFTAYYSPDFVGSKVKTDFFKYAIYTTPKDETLRKLTRKQIDFQGKLAGKGYELFYVNDLFGLYLMHIEGGGRVTVFDENQNPTQYYLSYAGKNDQSFKFIGQYMVDQGMITANTTVAQRQYIEQNPDKLEQIFSYCPGYIYFKVTDHPPYGVNNIPLTDNRSIATDLKFYPQKGLISYVVSNRPSLQNGEIINNPFSRFFLDQDTGGAIKGKARADLYFGFGEEAELTANNLKQYGEIYFLIKKDKASVQRY